MKKRALLALNAMAVSVICIAAAPAHAVDHWSLQQFEQIQTRTAGQGYAVGFARNVGTVTQKEISLDAGRGIGLNFSNLNVSAALKLSALQLRSTASRASTSSPPRISTTLPGRFE